MRLHQSKLFETIVDQMYESKAFLAFSNQPTVIESNCKQIMIIIWVEFFWFYSIILAVHTKKVSLLMMSFRTTFTHTSIPSCGSLAYLNSSFPSLDQIIV